MSSRSILRSLLVCIYGGVSSESLLPSENDMRLVNGNTNVVKMESSNSTISYVFTEHRDTVVHLNCSSGSLGITALHYNGYNITFF